MSHNIVSFALYSTLAALLMITVPAAALAADTAPSAGCIGVPRSGSSDGDNGDGSRHREYYGGCTGVGNGCVGKSETWSSYDYKENGSTTNYWNHASGSTCDGFVDDFAAMQLA